jgi:hypothetical protein
MTVGEFQDVAIDLESVAGIAAFAVAFGAVASVAVAFGAVAFGDCAVVVGSGVVVGALASPVLVGGAKTVIGGCAACAIRSRTPRAAPVVMEFLAIG